MAAVRVEKEQNKEEWGEMGRESGQGGGGSSGDVHHCRLPDPFLSFDLHHQKSWHNLRWNIMEWKVYRRIGGLKA